MRLKRTEITKREGDRSNYANPREGIASPKLSKQSQVPHFGRRGSAHHHNHDHVRVRDGIGDVDFEGRGKGSCPLHISSGRYVCCLSHLGRQSTAAPPLPAWIDAVISNLTAARMAGMTEATMIAPVDGGFGADECRRACQADIITAVVSITIQRTLGELARCSLARSHTECLCNGSRAACGRLTIPRLAPHARSRAAPPRAPPHYHFEARHATSERAHMSQGACNLHNTAIRNVRMRKTPLQLLRRRTLS